METIFADRAEAYRMLEDTNHRQRRNSLFEMLMREGALQFSKAIVYRCWWGVYYVSEEGAVYRLDYKRDAGLKEAMLRAVEAGELPKKMVEVEGEQELRIVDETLGKVRPELALVIAPQGGGRT